MDGAAESITHAAGVAAKRVGHAAGGELGGDGRDEAGQQEGPELHDGAE